jgi:hypothetical protein
VEPRFYVQGETVRGEPRIYWVVDRSRHHCRVSETTRDKRQAERWCKKLTENWRSRTCPTCHAELRLVATCGICGRDMIPF